MNFAQNWHLKFKILMVEAKAVGNKGCCKTIQNFAKYWSNLRLLTTPIPICLPFSSSFSSLSCSFFPILVLSYLYSWSSSYSSSSSSSYSSSSSASYSSSTSLSYSSSSTLSYSSSSSPFSLSPFQWNVNSEAKGIFQGHTFTWVSRMTCLSENIHCHP